VGKTQAEIGDMEAASQAWGAAAEADPTGYYALRAGDLLAGRSPFQPVTELRLDVDLAGERQRAERWLRQTFNLPPEHDLEGLSPELERDPRMRRAEEYWQLGMWAQAKGEYEALRAHIQGDPEATYRLMNHLLDRRLYQPAIFAARHILDLAGMETAETYQGPTYLNRVRFGLYFWDLFSAEAEQRGMDPLLLISVARQESLFEPFITSYAAARGLMQVIPPTGQYISEQLGWPPGYNQDDLYRAVVSARFGAFYLAEQRDFFEGDWVAALAAYNAGPGNAAAWKQLAPEDPDLFVEVVRFEQPRRYIRSIYEIYRIYQDLYARP
jgi:soluble lytic murein transglycosylase